MDDILAKAGKATKYAKMMSSVSGGSDGAFGLEGPLKAFEVCS